jgi:hypothetical protein
MPRKTKTNKRELIEPKATNALFAGSRTEPSARPWMSGNRFPPTAERRPKRRCRKVRATGVTRSGNLVAQSSVVVDNAAIAELRIGEAKTAEGHREQAFRRAAQAAFMWSEGLSIAGGLDETRLAEQGREIVALNKQLRWRRFPSSESSIL